MERLKKVNEYEVSFYPLTRQKQVKESIINLKWRVYVLPKRKTCIQRDAGLSLPFNHRFSAQREESV